MVKIPMISIGIWVEGLTVHSMSDPRKVVEIEHADGMHAPVAVSSGQLLKDIHIADLKIVVFVHMVMETGEEPVLVVIVVGDLSPEIHEDLVAGHQGEGARLETPAAQRELGEYVVS